MKSEHAVEDDRGDAHQIALKRAAIAGTIPCAAPHCERMGTRYKAGDWLCNVCGAGTPMKRRRALVDSWRR